MDSADNSIKGILLQLNAPMKEHETGVVVWKTPNTFAAITNDERRFLIEVGILNPSKPIVTAKLEVQKQGQSGGEVATGFMPHPLEAAAGANETEGAVEIADVVGYLVAHITALGEPTMVDCAL